MKSRKEYQEIVVGMFREFINAKGKSREDICSYTTNGDKCTYGEMLDAAIEDRRVSEVFGNPVDGYINLEKWREKQEGEKKKKNS